MNSDLIRVCLVKTNGQMNNLKISVDLDRLHISVFKNLTVGNFKAKRGGSLNLVNTDTYCVARQNEDLESKVRQLIFDSKNSLHLHVIDSLINK